jgi:hypothetical protein
LGTQSPDEAPLDLATTQIEKKNRHDCSSRNLKAVHSNCNDSAVNAEGARLSGILSYT